MDEQAYRIFTSDFTAVLQSFFNIASSQTLFIHLNVYLLGKRHCRDFSTYKVSAANLNN